MLAVHIRQQLQCKDRFATRNIVLDLYRFFICITGFSQSYPLIDVLERNFRLGEITWSTSNIKNLFVYAAT